VKIDTVQIPEMAAFPVEVVDHYETANVEVYCCIWLDGDAQDGDAFLLLHHIGADVWTVTNGQKVAVTFKEVN
jgi:hypothetical protein